jgi:hypothetical protein
MSSTVALLERVLRPELECGGINKPNQNAEIKYEKAGSLHRKQHCKSGIFNLGRTGPQATRFTAALSEELPTN